jgi:hypothetical protein
MGSSDVLQEIFGREPEAAENRQKHFFRGYSAGLLKKAEEWPASDGGPYTREIEFGFESTRLRRER